MGFRWSWLVTLGACSYAPSAATVAIDGAGDDDAPPGDAAIAGKCDPLPRGAAPIQVSDVDGLKNALGSAAPGSTIELADGIYPISTGSITIATAGITLRSASGDATKVVFDGTGNFQRLIKITASNVTLTEVTVAHSGGTGIEIEPPASADSTGVRIHRVTFDDDGGPAIRIKTADGTVDPPFADSGTISCSQFIDTTAVDHCAPGTLGIDGQSVRDWTVRDNLFQNVRCEAGFSRNVVFRFGSRDTKIIDNVFRGSNANIMLGGEVTSRTYTDALPVGCSGTPDHRGGVVCNNVIDGQQVPLNQQSSTDFEEGIALWSACDAYVIHNTIASPIGAETFHDIEYRFGGTFVHLINNLVEEAPASRDGGAADTAFAASNPTYALVDFVDASTGDLHLAPTSTVPAGASIAALGMCAEDLEGKPRDLAAPDPGAYER